MSSREIDRRANESANSPRESAPDSRSEAEHRDYRLALHARILALDPSYAWTTADHLDADRMCEQGIDLDRAAESFVAARSR